MTETINCKAVPSAEPVKDRAERLSVLISGANLFMVSVRLIAALLLSRLALLADGPWEQDEALFATGVLDYDVVHHRPHPPGFPGWIALGKLLYPLTGDALLSLRVWSSVASVVTDTMPGNTGAGSFVERNGPRRDSTSGLCR